MTLPVSELFGPTWQGEGPALGRRAAFLRLMGCNLSCEWCDTPYTWDTTRFDLDAGTTHMHWHEIRDQLGPMQVGLLVITGGEPLLHVNNYSLRALTECKDIPEIHVETNGTIPPPTWFSEAVSLFVVSPKIGTRDPDHKRLNRRSLREYALLADRGRAVFKFVVQDDRQLDVVVSLIDQLVVKPEYVYIMAEGTDAETILERQKALTPRVQMFGFNLTTRLHILLWGDERGR